MNTMEQMDTQKISSMENIRLIAEIVTKANNKTAIKTFSTYIPCSKLSKDVVSLIFKLNSGIYEENELIEFFDYCKCWDSNFKQVWDTQDVTAVTINLKYSPNEDETMTIENISDYNMFISRLNINNIKNKKFAVSYQVEDEELLNSMENSSIMESDITEDIIDTKVINVDNLIKISDKERLSQVTQHAYKAASSGKYFIQECLSTKLANELVAMGLKVTQETLNVYKISWLK